MRVLITGSTPVLGLAFHFVQFAVWLKKYGVDVALAGCDGEGTPGLFKKLAEERIPFFDLPALRRTGLGQAAFPTGGLGRLIEKEKFDIAIITASGHVAEVGRRRPNGVKVVWWLQSVRNTRWYARAARRMAAWIADRWSDQTWIQCELERQKMVAAGLRKSPVNMVSIPIDVPWWESRAGMELPRQLQNVAEARRCGRRVISYPASLLPGKRHDTLLKAAAIVRRSIPELFVCCPGRYKADGLRPLAKSLGLDDCVMFTESILPQECIPPLLAASDALAFTSESETYGKSLIEAWCLGVPVVSTRAGVAYEAELAGAAIVCDIGDHEAVAEGILRVLREKPTAERLRETGKKFVRENYSYEAVIGRAVECLEALVR